MNANVTEFSRMFSAKRTKVWSLGFCRCSFLPEELEKSEGSAQTLRMKITAQRIGGIWHGYLEEMARVKVKRIIEQHSKREGRRWRKCLSASFMRRKKSPTR